MKAKVFRIFSWPKDDRGPAEKQLEHELGKWLEGNQGVRILQTNQSVAQITEDRADTPGGYVRGVQTTIIYTIIYEEAAAKSRKGKG